MRLTARGVSAGVVGRERAAQFQEHADGIAAAEARARAEAATAPELRRHGIDVAVDAEKRACFAWLAHPHLSEADRLRAFPWLAELAPRVRAQLDANALYDGYLGRQDKDIAWFRKEEAVVISPELDYAEIGGLSAEMQERLQASRPPALGAAGRIPGITPAALSAILAHVRKTATVRRFT